MSEPAAAANHRLRQSLLLCCAAGLWLSFALGGFYFVYADSFQPGEHGATPAQWPTTSTLPRDDQHHALVMFLHPGCPCSRASLSELDALLAATTGAVRATVVIVIPRHSPTSFLTSEYVETARRIPGVSVVLDHDGAEASLFGGMTSGQVVLYQPDGKLAFSGGITISKGHAGPSPGKAAIRSLLKWQNGSDQTACPVFGCPFTTKADKTSRGRE